MCYERALQVKFKELFSNFIREKSLNKNVQGKREQEKGKDERGMSGERKLSGQP